MNSPITIMPAGNLFRVTYVGKSTECDWAEMIALVSSLTIPLKLHIAPPAELTIERPCLDWLKDDPVPVPTKVVNTLCVALTPPLAPKPPEPVPTPRRVLPRLADVDEGYEEPEPERPEPKTYAHISDPDTFYEFVDDQKWGALEEQVYRFIARNEPHTAGFVAAQINEHSCRVGRAVTASKRLQRVGSKIHIRASYRPAENQVTPAPTKGVEMSAVEAEQTAEVSTEPGAPQHSYDWFCRQVIEPFGVDAQEVLDKVFLSQTGGYRLDVNKLEDILVARHKIKSMNGSFITFVQENYGLAQADFVAKSMV